MLGANGVKEAINNIALLMNTEETAANCMALQEMLAKLDCFNLGYMLIMPSKQNHYNLRQQKQGLLAAQTGAHIEWDKMMNLLPATLAIELGKGKFFEIVIDAYPKALCATHCSYNILVTPLMCALANRVPAIVSTVLRNMNFLAQEFNNPKSHTKHITYCMAKGMQNYSNPMNCKEAEIMQMLKTVLEIRVPLISAIAQKNLFWISTIITDSYFINHEIRHPEAHKTLLLDCIECAKKWCNQPTMVLDLLQVAVTIKVTCTQGF